VLDKDGKPSTAYDVIFNPNVIDASNANFEMKQFVVGLCLDWIDNKTGGRLDREVVFPKLKYKGATVLEQAIRSDALVEEVLEPVEVDEDVKAPQLNVGSANAAMLAADYAAAGADRWGLREFDQPDRNSIEESKRAAAWNVAKPNWTASFLDVNDNQLEQSEIERQAETTSSSLIGSAPEGSYQLKLCIELDFVRSAAPIEVLANDTSLVINVPRQYHLTLELPPVDETAIDAEFDSYTSQLVVLLPLVGQKPSCEAFPCKDIAQADGASRFEEADKSVTQQLPSSTKQKVSVHPLMGLRGFVFKTAIAKELDDV
jgi:hypothetical protein